MRFKCPSCGIELDDIQQLASHKKQHQSASQESSQGVTCIGCAKKIPLDPSKNNYSGPLTCPSCQRTMSVILRDGEVIIARLG